MTLIIGIGVLLLGIAMVLMAANMKDIKETADLARFDSEQNHKAIVQTIATVNNNTKAVESKFAQADAQIDEIIERMDYLAKTIEKVDHDEKDLRSYYINYREPKFSNAGVEWAEEYVTNDDEH